ncbi:sulfatase-like hydrolase/transferase [Desulfonatronospira sp.]|uniref:sulfatase-like hydrolase/transferase n=1 Tax=Desulfonatronospira sp. TaxID=1962951 RepID=UPI0025B8FEC4|nr:sulfatase-like hydrolase/transferase [Desulfonatronospira sp.]
MKSFFLGCLHIFVLAGFAVAQPVYDLLRQNPEFLVSHRTSPVLIIGLVLVLSVGLPLALCLLKLLLIPLGRGLQRGLHLLIVCSLVVLTFLPLVKRLLPADDFLILGFALLSGIVFTVLYAFLRPVGTIVSVLTPAIIIFPLWFLFMTPVSRLVMPQDVQALSDIQIKEPVPVILIVLDELNTRALLDESGRIDQVRFPNFAQLAEQSYWFPNAVGPHTQTMHALPAILTGRQARDGLNPTAADHPQNLFTLLGGQYKVNVLEAETNLCPQVVCDPDLALAQTRKADTFWADLGIIYLHIIAPPDQARRLPALDGQWTGFAGTVVDRDDQAADQPRGMDRRGEQFESFIAGIDSSRTEQLHFLHIIMPHLPYEYLSTGHRYNQDTGPIFPAGIRNESSGWSQKETLVHAAHGRYLQQVGFTDLLLGRLIQKLKTKDIYDKSLVIVTADHGVSFQPGFLRRGITPETTRDVLKVPMLVKLPGQEQGQIKERLVSGLDILPTIADVLEIDLPWEVHGRSMFSKEAWLREEIELTEDLTFKDKEIVGFPRLKWQLKYFGSGTSLDGLVTKGPFEDLIGRELSELSLYQSDELRFHSEMTAHFRTVDPDSGFLPALFSGYISGTDELDLPLAVALNSRIRATTTTARWLQMERYFTALLPPGAFEPGDNNLQLFRIKEGKDEPSLVRILCAQEAMSAVKIQSRTDGREVLILDKKNHVFISSGQDQIRGYVDHSARRDNTMLIRGWAGDKQYQSVEAILVFSGKRLLAETGTRVQRRDVAEHFNRESMLHSGFQVQIPFDPEQNDPGDIRVIAVSKDQKAGELQWTD